MFGLKLKSCGLTNLVGIIVFVKLSAINGFVDSLPAAVYSRIANSFLLFRHGELITIFGVVVKPSLDKLSTLWLSYSRICDALAVRQGDSSFFCFDFTRINLNFKESLTLTVFADVFADRFAQGSVPSGDRFLLQRQGSETGSASTGGVR
ncbi:hypothetical protein Tco_1153695 [Tanacetum coccineum]